MLHTIKKAVVAPAVRPVQYIGATFSSWIYFACVVFDRRVKYHLPHFALTLKLFQTK
jgi:hypothetical protein